MALKLRKSGEKVSDVVFPLYFYVRNITLFFKSAVHLGLHGDFSCLQVFLFCTFLFSTFRYENAKQLYIFLSTACVSVPLLLTVLIPS